MNTWLDRRMLIEQLLEHFPSSDIFGRMILFEWSWWKDDSQILDIFKDIEYVCRRRPKCHVTVNSIPEDIWTYIPEVKNYLITKNINIDDMGSIARTLMPLPNGSQDNEITAYEAIVNRWLNDFRYFLPILADAELWIRAFYKLNSKREIDEQ